MKARYVEKRSFAAGIRGANLVPAYSPRVSSRILNLSIASRWFRAPAGG